MKDSCTFSGSTVSRSYRLPELFGQYKSKGCIVNSLGIYPYLVRAVGTSGIDQHLVDGMQYLVQMRGDPTVYFSSLDTEEMFDFGRSYFRKINSSYSRYVWRSKDPLTFGDQFRII